MLSPSHGENGAGAAESPRGKSCSVSGPCGRAAGPETLRWPLLHTAGAPLPESKAEVVGPGLSTCCACGGASALLGCWCRKSRTPLRRCSLEQRLCSADGDSGRVSGADRHPFPGGNEPGRRRAVRGRAKEACLRGCLCLVEGFPHTELFLPRVIGCS